MKIGLVTTDWKEERCGIAEYARNLCSEFAGNGGFEFEVFGRSQWDVDRIRNSDCSIVHVNYEPGLFDSWFTSDSVRSIKATGKKTLLTLHTSSEGNNRNGLPTDFDVVVVHERTTDGFVHIPMGIPRNSQRYSYPPVDGKGVEIVGTVGFPFPWKGFPEVAEAADRLGKHSLILAPESRHYDTEAIHRVVQMKAQYYNYRRDWLQQDEVIDLLTQCQVNVFAYSGNGYGISGAVRMGLAAGRPLVLTRSRQFRDLFDYEDEIEFIGGASGTEVMEGIVKVLANGKKPQRVLQDMAWSGCAERYRQIYESMA